jgi:hypothetical protein
LYVSIVFGAPPVVGEPWQLRQDFARTSATEQGSPLVVAELATVASALPVMGDARSLLAV